MRSFSWWIPGLYAFAFGCTVENVELSPARPVSSAAPPAAPASPPSAAPLPLPTATSTNEVSVELPLTSPPPEPVQNAGAQPLPAVEMPPKVGCQRADILFVIDNSPSMLDQQQKLADSFPQFVQDLRTSLGVEDLNIMVVDTDGERLLERIQRGDSPPDECQGGLGVGLTNAANGADCGVAPEHRYLVASQPNLAETFACTAQVGADGAFIERPAEALLSATSPEFNAAGACNAGFLRDDAILVAIVITDEDDDNTDGDPADWHAALVARKQGNEAAVVTLGLLRPEGVSCPFTLANRAPKLEEFLTSFPHSGVGDLCAADYAPILTLAAATAGEACAEFVPN
jgi:hypothetical protein